jgi:hypothetical protein
LGYVFHSKSINSDKNGLGYIFGDFSLTLLVTLPMMSTLVSSALAQMEDFL